jgi:hypothetical protein
MPKGDWIKFNPEFEKEILKLHDTGKSATEIGKITGKFTSSILRVLKRNNRKLNRVYQGKGENHSQWKGGRSVHGQSGYWTVYAPNHPRRKANNRVFEHIIIAEKKYGREIKKGEPIHHIDFDKLNNNPKNIYLCKNHSEHQKLNKSMNKIFKELYNRDLIFFRNGQYYTNN